MKKEYLEKYHPGCLRDEHIPCAVVDKHNRIIEVICQNCFISMTKEDHKNYFKKDPYSQIDYDNPGDSNDVDRLCST